MRHHATRAQDTHLQLARVKLYPVLRRQRLDLFSAWAEEGAVQSKVRQHIRNPLAYGRARREQHEHGAYSRPYSHPAASPGIDCGRNIYAAPKPASTWQRRTHLPQPTQRPALVKLEREGGRPFPRLILGLGAHADAQVRLAPQLPRKEAPTETTRSFSNLDQTPFGHARPPFLLSASEGMATAAHMTGQSLRASRSGTSVRGVPTARNTSACAPHLHLHLHLHLHPKGASARPPAVAASNCRPAHAGRPSYGS